MKNIIPSDESSESLHQIAFVSWFRKTFPGVKIWSSLNGAHLSGGVYKKGKPDITAIKRMSKLKAEGQTNGVPDLEVPEWNLYVEMKRQKGGKISQDQKEIIEYLVNVCKKTVIIGYGFEDAKEKVLECLKKYYQ